MVPMSFDQHINTLVLNIMKGMSYIPCLRLGHRQQGQSEFSFTIDRDIPYRLGYTPFEDDARHMAWLRRDMVRAHYSRVPFDYPLHPYTFQLVHYITRGLEHTPHTKEVNYVSGMV